jgi:hypothetical protein
MTLITRIIGHLSTDHIMMLGRNSRIDQILTNSRDLNLKKVCGGLSLTNIVRHHICYQGEVTLQVICLTDLKVREDLNPEVGLMTGISLLGEMVKVQMTLN